MAELSKLCLMIRGLLEKEKISPHTLYAVELSLEEMVTNIIKYGYDDKNTHEILVNASLTDRQIILSIEDDGHEFNPLERPDADISSQVTERKIGGVGLHLTRKMVKSMEYKRDNGKNILKIFIDIK